MAENGRELQEQSRITVDKEIRIRQIKDRQNEDRQRKLEEIKAQALAAQRFKEQKELERRKRLDDLRLKDDIRRKQVEDRKRAINDAERDRLEFILKRNQEREARIESKKRNERSNAVFAFGSSTPRMLEPADMTVSFWGHRRATSTQNLPSSSSSLTRRQSERDLDNGNKRRATSASGLERSGECNAPTTPAGCVSGYIGRRRTDLMPTVPSRDSSFTSASSRKSLNHSPASSRPSSSLSQQSTNSVSNTVNMRHRTTPRKQRPASIAITGVTSAEKNEKPPIPKSKKMAKSGEKILNAKPKTKPSVVDNTTSRETLSKSILESSQMKEAEEEEKLQKPPDFADVAAAVDNFKITEIDNSNKMDTCVETSESNIDKMSTSVKTETQVFILKEREINQVATNSNAKIENSINESNIIEITDTQSTSDNLSKEEELLLNNEVATVTAKPRITTEEEAKAALAERRRLAREEAERQAEMERARIEAEQREELERQMREEEQVRQLIEIQRKAEQERLQEAIREVQKRGEEDRLKREEELRLKQIKEEADKKAKEEAERQKIELQEKLKNEEKERELRRKRVEAIMLRTRGKNITNSSSQQNSEDRNENKSDENEQIDDIKVIEENKVNENAVNGTKNENGMTHASSNEEDMNIANMISDDKIKNGNAVTNSITTDSINSNSMWPASQQYSNIVYNNNS